jgi:hypothetical protein
VPWSAAAQRDNVAQPTTEEGTQMAKGDPRPVTGRKKAGASLQSHSTGWDAALDNALKKTGWKAGSYKSVHVEFYANVDVVNPGRIVEYAVTLTPSG